MRTLMAIIVVTLLTAGCGGGESDMRADGDGAASPATSTGAGDAATTVPSDITTAPPEEAPPPPSQENNVLLELEDGTLIETTALCMLEPQEVGSSTILFTATGYSETGFDVTQFDEASFGGEASVNFYLTEDFQNYELFWESDSTVGELELELDGSTIRGTGNFFEGDAQGNYDPFGDEAVAGTLTVDCG